MCALKTKGSVSSKILQPDSVTEQDGFGLLTSRVTYRCDENSVIAATPKPGDAHPNDGRMKCHRTSYTINKSGLATVQSEFIGVESGDRTRIQIKCDISTSTQPIQSHKDFNTKLKNDGWSTQAGAFLETNPKAVQAGLVGVRSFLVADSVVSATYYTAVKSEVNDAVNMVGKTFLTMGGMEDLVLPSGNISISPAHDRFAMLAGVSYEKFAHLYKISFSIRISPGGFHNKVYTKHN